MMTLCIRYTLDANKLADFDAYAQALRQPVERCGGKFVAYYLPTKIAGPTNAALGLIDFPNLAAYESYREKLASDPDGVACLRRVEAAGCILNEERSSCAASAPDTDGPLDMTANRAAQTRPMPVRREQAARSARGHPPASSLASWL